MDTLIQHIDLQEYASTRVHTLLHFMTEHEIVGVFFHLETFHIKARAKHSPFAKNPDLAIIGERISGLSKILAKDFQLLGKK